VALAITTMLDGFDDDFVVAPRPARPQLVDLPALETLVLETLPVKVLAMRAKFDEEAKVRNPTTVTHRG
jgi:hypothetical protein